jgi:hypothetical protein
MSTISATTHRTASMNLFIAFAIVIVAALAFAVVSSIVVTKPDNIPVTGNQNAYSEYLLGEKVIFGKPTGVGSALSAYRSGEKILFAAATNPDDALTWFHLGEKYVMSPAEYALLIYRAGEKGNR